jgi:TolB-like protein
MRQAGAVPRRRIRDVSGGHVEREVEAIDQDRVRFACEAILASEQFARANRMRRLLRFLVEQALSGNDRNTSEYAIGIAVFDRDPAAYMPTEDPVVRVQVGRLRQRLESYYARSRDASGIEISIPLGRYMPVIRRTGQAEAEDKRQDCLVVQPIHCIEPRREGRAFACGLYEELLNQLFRDFGGVLMMPDLPEPARGTPARGRGGSRQVRAPHCIESSLRIDAERIRTSVRIVDASLRRIMWSGHFDTSVHFGIRQQEALATSICSALRQVIPR